ncbi:hypothetical protein [Bifidobacterium parmae]|uniref:Uncharacterized protein n=1 Tax=Bifidobacterium parmae TaxID=361854 RepID=A0A2N5IVM6_9BIFI|nr:hypothetical protein [Bifidobacterium parmae]PLS25997.1 hypothetical protein Uis4E_2172 [Bifidobacterium parmae]
MTTPQQTPQYGQMLPQAPETTPQNEPTATAPKSKSLPIWAAAIAAAVGLIVGAAVGYPLGRSAEAKAQWQATQTTYQKQLDEYNGLLSKLRKTSKACQPTDAYSRYADSLDYSDGTLTLTTGKYSAGTTLECVEEKMDMPSTLTSQIGMTNAFNGVQNADFDGYTVTWSFNGNSGLNFTVTPSEEKPQNPNK